MIILQGSNLTRRFGADTLFSNVDLAVQDNSRIGLVGRNGTGKSTLLKILAREEEPDEGQVSTKRNISIAYMDQYATVQANDDRRTVYGELLSVFDETLELIDESLAVADELAQTPTNSEAYEEVLKRYDAIQERLNNENAYRYETEIRIMLTGFQFPEEDWEKPITQLSGGQRARLALAKVLLEKKDLLILDEPTNHLDIETLSWLEDYLPSYKGALIIVSHDRYFLDKVTTETIEMRFGTTHRFAGNYSFYLRERDVRFETAQKAYEKQQKEIKNLETFVQKNIARSSTTKLAQSRRNQLQKMTRLPKPIQDDKAPRIQFSAERDSGNVVLQTHDLGIGYDGEIVSYPIQLDVRKQNAVGIIGPNGIGKSTLLKTLVGKIPALKGDFTFGANVSVGYYDQELSNLHNEKDVLHEIWDDYPTLDEQKIRSLLGSFLFTADAVTTPVSLLSGGEKARLVLAKLSLRHDNFLLLDEPTNHLDISSKEILEDALIQYDGTLIFVSHDRYFINRIATTIVELTEEGSKIYLGDYNYYVQKKAEEEARAKAEEELEELKNPVVVPEKVISDGKSSYLASKEAQKQRRQLQREVEDYEEELDLLDQKISTLEEQMTQPEILEDFEKMNTLNQDLIQMKEDQNKAEQNWEKAALALEAFDEKV